MRGATNERSERYQAIIEQLLRADANAIHPSHGTIETLLLVDPHQESTMLLYIGWSGTVRHHDIIVHARVRAGTIWIERDGTTEGFATTLVAAGIPPKDIVLAFQHPHKRPFTEFGDGTKTQ